MLTPELKKQLLDAAVVRFADCPPALSKLKAQLDGGTLPGKALGLLLLDATGLRWSAVPQYADRKLVAFLDAWFERSDNIKPMGMLKTPTPKRTIATNKLRGNTLDVVIDKAIDQAGCLDNNAVWLQLKELALAVTAPFTGEVETASLAYTNDKNEHATFSKNALCQRLLRRRKN